MSWRVGASTGAATAEALQQAREAVNRAVQSVDDADRELAAANVALEQIRDRERRVAHRLSGLVTQIREDLEARRVALESRLGEIERELTRLDERASVLRDRRSQIESRLGRQDEARRDAESRRLRREGLLRALDSMYETVATVVQKAESVLRVLESSREAQAEERATLRRRVQELRRERARLAEELSALGEKLRKVELRRTQVEVRLEGVTSRIWQEFGEDPEEMEEPAEPDVPPGSTPREHLRLLEAELEALGPVNPLALEEFDSLSERHDFLTRQLEDVRKSRRELRGVIRGIEQEMVAIFSSAFADVSANFSELFEKLFPGGEGRLVLTDPDDLLNTGVEVVARPSGKNVKKLTLLSGGERSLAALAFLFAVFRSRPSPFYVMDEVEAALDDVNLHRFLTLLEEFRRDAQLVIVTHQKRTMEAADCLYGVTMRPGGSSQVLSERVASVIV
ncbi:MAG: hypothetical protein KatS3mg008_0712 [Acidimicrobiales bacterium]|nr:MAG: hypothetical protein KatS3mg008_0712 [Acidimicrobiales bacterium]